MPRRSGKVSALGAVATWITTGAIVALGFGSAIIVIAGLALVVWRMFYCQRQLARRSAAPPDGVSVAQRVVLWAIRLFPTEFGLAAHNHRLGVALILLTAGTAVLLTADRRPVTSRPPLDVVAFAGLSALAWFLQHSTRWEIGVLASFAALIFAIRRADVDWATTISAIHDSLGIFMIVNVVLYYGVGVHLPQTGRRVVVEGVFGVRPDFPLAGAVTTPPAVCAAYIAGLIAYRGIRSSWRGGFQAVAFVVCMFALLVTNGRASTAAGIVIGVLALAGPGVLRRAAPVVVLIALCVPVGFESLGGSADAVAHHIPFSHRKGAATAQPFGNRGPIWRAILDGYGEQSLGRQLVGWGATGQYTSGISQQYASFLAGYLRYPLYAPAHSTVLQLLLDSGIAGVTALLVAITCALRRLGRAYTASAGFNRTAASAGIAMLTTIGCAGMTDALIAPGQNQETFWMVMLLFIAAGVSASAIEQRAPESLRDDSHTIGFAEMPPFELKPGSYPR